MIVNVPSALSPAAGAVPAVVLRRQATVAVPDLPGAGVKRSTPSAESDGATENSAGADTEVTASARCWPLSSSRQAESSEAQLRSKAPEPAATVTSAPARSDGASLTASTSTRTSACGAAGSATLPIAYRKLSKPLQSRAGA